mmetsp:Transcript_23603/g.65469  ORF Transcript_23603/g.65469 Transcript_23603/m.65469 type:complete len:297 (+) Transcript_23603:733-1623(+)
MEVVADGVVEHHHGDIGEPQEVHKVYQRVGDLPVDDQFHEQHLGNLDEDEYGRGDAKAQQLGGGFPKLLGQAVLVRVHLGTVLEADTAQQKDEQQHGDLQVGDAQRLELIPLVGHKEGAPARHLALRKPLFLLVQLVLGLRPVEHEDVHRRLLPHHPQDSVHAPDDCAHDRDTEAVPDLAVVGWQHGEHRGLELEEAHPVYADAHQHKERGHAAHVRPDCDAFKEDHETTCVGVAAGAAFVLCIAVHLDKGDNDGSHHGGDDHVVPGLDKLLDLPLAHGIIHGEGGGVDHRLDGSS